jgi:hypothetical protein
MTALEPAGAMFGSSLPNATLIELVGVLVEISMPPLPEPPLKAAIERPLPSA